MYASQACILVQCHRGLRRSQLSRTRCLLGQNRIGRCAPGFVGGAGFRMKRKGNDILAWLALLILFQRWHFNHC